MTGRGGTTSTKGENRRSTLASTFTPRLWETTMTNRFEQSQPPSVHDVYRGLPLGPLGVSPFIYRDRGPQPRPPVRLPWRVVIGGMRSLARRLVTLLRKPRARHQVTAIRRTPAACCQHV